MKRSGILAGSIWMALLVVTLALILSSPTQSQAAVPAAAPQQATNQVEYFTRTLATASPSTNNTANIGWLKVSGDWVGYDTETVGCGHCGLFISGLNFINVINNQRIHIKPSMWGYDRTSGGVPKGALAVKMYAPYVVWTQPGKKVPGDGYSFAAGQFDCTICYYNLSTGEGGPVTSLQGLDPTAASLVYVLDVDYTGRVLARVQGAADLWGGKIGEPNSTLIKTGLAPDKITEGLAVIQNRYAWIADKNVYIDDVQANRGRQIGSGADHLVDGGAYFFWHTDAGMKTYTDDPNGRTVIEGASGDYDVKTTTDLGDIAAWISTKSSGTNTNYELKLAGFNISGTFSALMTRTQKNVLRELSLDYNKMVFIEETPGQYFPTYDLQLVWLVKPDPAFATVWNKSDAPVASGKANRSWLWGPQANYMGKEEYSNSTDGSRLVRYYDKSRMEVNNPKGNKNDPYYVTNGLLVTEMIAGEIQLGDNSLITAKVACDIPIVGDPRKDNPLTPGYAALAGVSSLHDDNKAANRTGQQVDTAIDVNGTVTADTDHKSLAKYAAYSPQTGHNIPDLFWAYLQKMPADYGFDWTFVLGYPISEAYWTQMRVGGKDLPVMIQAFQRRVLTYVPSFDPNWRVQMGNVGQHYFEWRYVINKDQYGN